MKRRSVNQRSPETVPPKKYLIIICLSYCFMGANFIISGIFVSYPYNADYKALIILGIIFLCRVPLAYFDNREGMRGKFYAIICCLLHFVISLLISYFHMAWWIMILYAVEVVISTGIVILTHFLTRAWYRHKSYKKNKPKQSR